MEFINGNAFFFTVGYRPSDDEWIIYTLCITGFTILTGVGHILRKYRNQQSLNLRITNEEVGLESLNPFPDIVIYAEVDENTFTFNTTELNIASQASSMKTINFISQGRQSITTEIEDDDTTGYLDLYFAMENDNKRDDCQEDSNACEVTVTVHQCNESSSRSEEEATSNMYSNVFRPLLTDKQINSQANVNPLSQEMTLVQSNTMGS
ncbi:unnamed protein product [Mytilus coruscus]|uniref:Uncharacterized protein n=1 Tax=Mytilus coruscus TaxID=42192 RepID=A0A6J8BEA1_MYTCO|nr:unnamed protein product [Mytilus coruscus]